MSFLLNPYRFAALSGGSFAFDGTDDYIQLASAPVTAPACTIVAWTRWTTTINTVASVSIGNSGGTSRIQIDLRASSNDVGAVAVNSGGTSGVAQGGNVSANVWSHCVGVFSASNSRAAYHDGTQVDTSATSITVSGLNNIIIGARYSGGTRGAFFPGQIAHVAIYNIALSGADITTLAGGAKPNTVQSGNLVFYAPLTGGVAQDIISSNMLTVSGAVTSSQTSPAGV